MREPLLLVVSVALTSATVLAWPALQSQPPTAPQAPTPDAPPKPIVPLAASSLVKNPDAYYGEPVSVTAAVERVLSPLAFTVDQDRTKPTDQEVLVLARRLNQPVHPNTYVTVVGPLARFDPEELRRRYPEFPLDLPAPLLDQFRGRPVVLAMNVVDSAGVDLARRLPPPMTPAEEAYSRTMKEVGQAQATLRKALEAGDPRLATEQASTLERAFDRVERFWKTRRRADAVDWARQAKRFAQTIERASAQARWDEVKAAATSLGGVCLQCHETYRERFDDGSFRVRIPPGTTGTAAIR